MADISPDLAARIESLKASHAENPARFFMPLASAWREAGEVGKAEELLRENLKRHPGYLSAHVLLGRCLADRGALAEARNEFQYVLSVDPQNLIALRTLGDMAAAQGQQADARRWYNELLAVDPMNADARQALHHLDANPAPPPPPPTEPKPNDDFGIVDLAGTPDAAGGEPADFGAWGEVGIDAGTDDIASAGERAADAAGPAWGEAPLDAAPAEWSSESAPAGDADAWGAVDLDADRAEDFAPTSADDRSASADGFDALDFGAVDVSSADTSFEASEPEPAASGFDGWGSVDDGQLDAASATPPLEGLEAFADAPVIGGAHDAHDDHAHEEEEVVTETMAELYARQGFLDRSADVYRELISRRGAEPALVRRLEELEAQMEGAAPSPSSSPYDFDTDEEEEAGPPAWLQAVDAASTASDDEPALPDLGLETTLPDLPTDLAAPPAVEAEEAQALADVSGASPFPISAGEPATADPGFVDSAPAGSDVGISMSGSGTFVTGGDPFADSFARGFGDADDMAADVGAGDERAAWETPTVEETEPVPGMLLDETPAFAVDTSAVDSAAAAYADFDDEPADRPAADLDQPTEDQPTEDQPTEDQPTEDQPAEDQPAEDQPAEIAALAEDVSIFAEPIDFASAAGDASAETEAEESAPAVESAPAAGEPSIRAYMAPLLTWRPGAAPVPTSFAPSAEPEPAPYEAPASEPAPAYDAPTDEPSPPFETPADEPSPVLEAPTEDNVPPYDAPAEEPADDEPWAAGAYVAEKPAASGPAPWETPAPAEDEPWAAGPSEPAGAGSGEDLPWMSAELDAPAPGEAAAPEGFEAMDRPAASEPAAPEGPRADELMPWDTPFDLAGEVEDAPVAERAGPRPEPTVQEAGGFSFEDFFGAPPAEPAGPAPTPALETRADLEPVFQPEPEPQPPAPPASGPGAPAGEEDEDLESFQAWLQSLKR